MDLMPVLQIQGSGGNGVVEPWDSFTGVTFLSGVCMTPLRPPCNSINNQHSVEDRRTDHTHGQNQPEWRAV